MSEPEPEGGEVTRSPGETEALGAVARKARRMAHARRTGASFYRELLQVGALGWVFILPVLGFVLFGHWLERRHGWGGATLLGIVLGIATGGGLVARRVRQTLREGREEETR